MIDIDTIASRYTGEARLQRLLLIHTVNHDTQALQMAIEQLKYHKNTHHRSLNIPNEWIQESETANRQARQILVQRLQSAQSHLHKETIRNALLALAEHDKKTGDLTEAFHSVLRAKDYCVNHVQTTEVSLLIIEVAIHRKQYHVVNEFVTKLSNTLRPDQTPELAKVKVASALAKLYQKNYAEAAELFRQVKNLEWPSVIAPEEVAVATAVLTLAYGHLSQIKTLVKDPEALELAPQLRESLNLFLKARYKETWESWPNLDLELFLAEHKETLTKQMKMKSIQLYWKAYERLPLTVMQQELGTLVDEDLTKTLVELIDDGVLENTRLNKPAGILERHDVYDPEEEVHEKLYLESRSVLDDTYANLIRIACIENNIVVTPTGKPSKHENFAAAMEDDGNPSNIMDSDEEMEDIPADEAAAAMNPEDMH